MGRNSILSPRRRPEHRLLRRSKDWSCTEFPFSLFSHKLSVDVKGEFYEHNCIGGPSIDPDDPSNQHINRSW